MRERGVPERDLREVGRCADEGAGLGDAIGAEQVRDTEVGELRPRRPVRRRAGASRMFDGLMSRWTTPAACTALSASASSPAMRATSASVMGPSASRDDSDGPSTRSMTR
jgi:hypothetical protein